MAVTCRHRTQRRCRNLVRRVSCRHTGCVPTDGAGGNRLSPAYAEHREDACHYYSLYAWNMLSLLITALWFLRNALRRRWPRKRLSREGDRWPEILRRLNLHRDVVRWVIPE